MSKKNYLKKTIVIIQSKQKELKRNQIKNTTPLQTKERNCGELLKEMF